MKKSIFLISLILLFLSTNFTSAQHLDYTTDSGFDIGFGLGGSYQKSDVRNSSGGAFDFTFGHSIYQREQSFFSLDWRFRFLTGRNTAFDDRILPDSTYRNVEYAHINMDLELVLTLNRLRNNTGIILSGFVGPGLAFNQTSFDLVDNFGSFGTPGPYDYSLIDPFGTMDRRSVAQQLRTLSDGEFETAGIDHFCFTPTAGLYFGYQFTKHFSLGIVHKMNLFIDESNSAIGADIDGYINSGSPFDMNNYTSLIFMWDIGKKKKNPVVPCYTPNVDFFVTQVNRGYITHELKGTITNVSYKAQISLTIDGNPHYDFQYITGTGQFSSGINLSPGTHNISITAANDCGQDSHTETVYVTIPCDPPVINLSVNNVNTSYASHELSGTILNVSQKSDIKVSIDGREDINFTFYPGSKRFSSFYKLNTGTHTITVSATTECASVSETYTVSVYAPCDPPILDVFVNEINLYEASHELAGTIRNVKFKDQISFSIDGIPFNAFQFIPNTGKISGRFNLSPGDHTVVVSATTECGQISETIAVYVNVPCDPPMVTFNVNEVNLSYATHELIGTVSNVYQKSDIKILVDGREDLGFTYFQGNKRISATYLFTPGRHTITVTAHTECGNDTRSQTVVVEAPCDLPYINATVNEFVSNYATHELNGTITNVRYKSEISVSVDGIPNNSFQYNVNTGRINAKYSLAPGNHTIIITVNTECGTDTQIIPVSVNAPCELPIVDLRVDEVFLNNVTHQISGTIYNVTNRSQVSFKVDGVINNSFYFIPNRHTFNADLNLSPGTHTIIVSATSDCGTDSKSFTVTVNAPCELPVIDFSVNESSQGSFTHQLTGTVYNVKNKPQITLRVDGAVNNAFQFIPGTHAISANLNLSPGTHTIIVSATNDCGIDSKTVTVTVNAPCDLPIIDFSVNESSQGSFTHRLTGTVYNIKNKPQITLKVDGVVNNAFQFIPSTHAISANLNLSPGTHTIIVSATNDCGTDSKTVSVTVNAPCDPPVVEFSVNESTQGGFTHQLSGTVYNVKNKPQITLKVDGVVNNAFQFIPGTHAISANLNLSPGTHTIIVSATNDCGTDSKTVTVTVEAPCDPPVVEFSVNESTQGGFTHQLSGTVYNVKNKPQITLKVDGVVNNAFQFIPSTHAISANLNLNPGTHTIIVSATNDCGTDSKTVTVTVNAPCDPPVVEFSVNESTQGGFTHQLSGTVYNVKNKPQITLKVDGVVNNAFQFIPGTHAISANLNLSPGTHTIIVSATNDCGTDSKTVTVTVNAPCDPPVVEFSVNESTQGGFTHQLSGTVYNVKNKPQITLKVDGVVNNAFQFIPSTHAISANLNLSPGTHTIIVSATNDCGTDSKTVTVTVNAPCDPPVVEFSVNESTQGGFTHQLSGTVYNVKNKPQITLKVDGVVNNAFQFIPSTHAISANLNLSPGTHTIIVSATNDCGTDSKTVTVTVNAPCDPPVVEFSVNEVNQNNVSHKLTGSVSNVSNKSQITLKVDGAVNNAFQFIPSTHAISANLNLNPGTHTIIVSATNDCGIDSKTVTVTVEAPCDPPVVEFSVNEVNQNNVSHKLTGSVSNVSNKSQITLKVDGAVNNAFQFIPSTRAISANLNLSPGTHTIIVSATNDCGADSKTVTVTVEAPCDPPVVEFSVNEVNQNNVSHKLTGSVSNVSNKSQITLKVDGAVNNAFQFIPSTHAISANLNLSPGTHTIIVSATNDCGTDSKTVTVTVEEQGPCGPRINPGNSEWEFCLVTPSGTYNRNHLSNSNFTYSGSASSLFFKAIAGGGNAIVNGNPYTVSPGQYYLFTGNLNVTVSTKNPGSMGQWSVCISADKTPQHGTGNNRPKSPCEGSGNSGNPGGRSNGIINDGN